MGMIVQRRLSHVVPTSMRLLPNTQPKQLEQQNRRLKEATAKVYYTDGRDNIIDQNTKHY